MGAVDALSRETEEASLEAAIEAANQWTLIARPIILATLRLDGVVEEELWELRKMEPDQRRTYDEANGYIQTARRCLDEMLDGIRSEFIADNMPDQPHPDAPDEEWEARDEFSDALESEVVSVKALIKLVEREDYEAFLKGARA